MLLALDPGTRSPGVAAFVGSVLVAAGHVNVPVIDGESDGARWVRAARLIHAWTAPHAVQDMRSVIFERPQWYQRSKSKGDPNQLAGVAGVAAALAGRLSILYDITVLSPTPAEWIGQLPKTCPVCGGKAKKKCLECRGSAWETPRGRFIRSRLTPSELALVPDQNDAIDAVGLGLFALKRLKPRAVFSNGRDGR